jgi:hypothetical protein
VAALLNGAQKVLIANPIYDTAFKRLMENDRVAKFLIGTILGCKVISLTHKAQERVKRDKVTGKLTLYRMDFIATIKAEGEESKKVIIEMQKAKRPGDIDRFRGYLGEEYVRSKLPIITIYILGFNISTTSAAFVANPELRDLQTNKKINVRDSFVEHLTHKAYFVQTLKIKQNLSTKLDTLLSVFAQSNIVSKDKTMLNVPFEPQYPEVKEVLKILNHVAVDEETRKELDDELYYENYVEQTFGEKDREIEQKNQQLEKQLEENKKQKEENKKQKEEIENLKKQIKTLKNS